MSADYGGENLRKFLLAELVAEGHLERRGTDYVFAGNLQDYRIGLTVTAITKTVRLSED